MAAILIITFAMGLIVGLPVAITMGISGLTAVLIDGRFPPLIVPQYLFNGISSFDHFMPQRERLITIRKGRDAIETI
jgi:uncharacterized membrane protein